MDAKKKTLEEMLALEAANTARVRRVRAAFRLTHRQCVECGRVFDMLDETDTEEWHYGHDCDPLTW